MQRKEYWLGFITGALAVAAGGILGVTVNHVQHVRRGYVMSEPGHQARLESLEDLIDEYYLEETDDEQLAQGVYKGLIDGLGDQYSYYYTPEEYTEEKESSRGSYEGIGVLMQSLDDGTILIVECYDNAPGKEAGLLAGDIITRVDDIDVTEAELADVVAHIREKVEGSIEISVLRGEGEKQKSLDITVPVTNVELPSVYSEMLEDDIGYIQITEFKSVTYHQFTDAYEQLQTDGMQRLIVDLRDNPGGYVDVVCDILREILPEGIIFYTEDKHGEREEFFSDGESPISIPLVVLVNGDSASASEIFAGAVKDYDIGTIVGTTTYGKGVVQSIRAYPDGSAVKLTTSHYYTPKGHDIHEVGIEPDVIVETEDGRDAQLERACELLAAESGAENA